MGRILGRVYTPNGQDVSAKLSSRADWLESRSFAQMSGELERTASTAILELLNHTGKPFSITQENHSNEHRRNLSAG